MMICNPGMAIFTSISRKACAKKWPERFEDSLIVEIQDAMKRLETEPSFMEDLIRSDDLIHHIERYKKYVLIPKQKKEAQEADNKLKSKPFIEFINIKFEERFDNNFRESTKEHEQHSGKNKSKQSKFDEFLKFIKDTLIKLSDEFIKKLIIKIFGWLGLLLYKTIINVIKSFFPEKMYGFA